MSKSRSVFRNKTIFRNISEYSSNEYRCDYIWYAITKTEEIFKKFGKYESYYHDDNEKRLFRYLKALTEIRPYIENLTNIKQQIYNHRNIIIDMIMKTIKNQYKGNLSEEYCDKYVFFLNQCMSIDTYFSNNMIMDLFTSVGVHVDSLESDYALLSTFNDVRSYLNNAKHYLEINIVRLYTRIYNEISDEYDDSHLFAHNLSDYSQELSKIFDTELYKAILLDASDDGNYHNIYLKDPKDWTYEERQKFEKYLYEGMGNYMKSTYTVEETTEETVEEESQDSDNDPSESYSENLPDPRNFPKEINPYHPDEMKKQLKDSSDPSNLNVNEQKEND